MKTSTSITAIAKALAAASASLRNPGQDATNPHFRSKYTSLVGLVDSLRAPLAAQGIIVLQPVSSPVAGRVRVETVLMHSSGEWMSSTADLPSGATAQSFGASVAYLRRYALQSMLGVSGDADADDDGEAERAKAEKPVVKKSATTVVRARSESGPTTPTDTYVVLKVDSKPTKSGTMCAHIQLGMPDAPDLISAFCWSTTIAEKLAGKVGQRVRLLLEQKVHSDGRKIDTVIEIIP
jgi:hypothetical protein